MPKRNVWIGALAGLALAACASIAPPPAPPPPPPPPDLTAPLAGPAPARTVLYTDCLAQAISAGTVAHVSDDSTQLIQFTCTGAAAQRFYEALSVPGEAAGSVWQESGRTFRSTAKVQKNLFGVDYCSSAAPGGAECHIVLNAGPFLTAPPL